MKLVRPAIFALVIAGAFFYFTTWHSNAKFAGAHSDSWFNQPAKVEITEAAAGSDSLDSEEQNNISVYRKNIPSVVNVTSRVLVFPSESVAMKCTECWPSVDAVGVKVNV